MKYTIIATNPIYDLEMVIKEIETDLEGEELFDFLSDECNELEQKFYKTVILDENQLIQIKSK